MKTLRVLFLAAFLSVPVVAEDYQIGVIGPFGGLNNTDNSLTIPANQASDLLNVDITPGGRSVKKRDGYATAITLGITTSAVHGTYAFYDSSGNDVVLAFNDRNITSSISGETASIIYSTATTDASWQCVDSQGFAYCANSDRDGIFKTNGVTVAPLTLTTTGTLLAVTPERLVQAGFSGANSNRIDFSKANDFTTWTVGSAPTDPITFTITAPGSKITHLVYAHKKVYWFKESSFGYILEGAELADWKPRIVSSEIGTLDNTSTQDTDGNLYFRSQEGHVYVTDGAQVQKLSEDINQSIGNSGLRTENSLDLTSAADFSAGTFTGNLVYVDTQTFPGNLVTTFPEPFTFDRNASSIYKNVWTDYLTIPNGTGSATVSGDQLRLASAGDVTDVSVRTTEQLPALSPGTSFHMKIDQIPTNASGDSDFYFIISSYVITGDIPGSGWTWMFNWQSTGTNTATLIGVGNGADTGASLTVSTTVTVPFTFSVWIATTVYSYGVNGTTIKSGTWSDPNSNAAKQQYVYFSYSSIGSTATALVDYFWVAPQTFTWVSAAQSIASSISAWDSFGVGLYNNAGDGSSHVGIRSASTDAYTTITDGQVPTIATSTYWQAIATVSYSGTGVGLPNVLITNISQAWFEGSATDKSYSVFHDEKIMFAVSLGGGQATNNRVLVYDLVTPGWTLYDWPVNGFYKRNQDLYFGSSNGGYVYKYGDSDSDNGSAINAYWKSKDFFLDNPFVDKEFVNISVAADSVTSSSATVTCTVNGSSTATFGIDMDSTKTFARKNQNLPLGKVGGTLNVQFGNNAADQPFELFAIQYGYRPKSWKPE